MKRKIVSIDERQALNIRAILINCQRMIEDQLDGSTDHAVALKNVQDILAGLGELGPLPKELELICLK